MKEVTVNPCKCFPSIVLLSPGKLRYDDNIKISVWNAEWEWMNVIIAFLAIILWYSMHSALEFSWLVDYVPYLFTFNITLK